MVKPWHLRCWWRKRRGRTDRPRDREPQTSGNGSVTDEVSTLPRGSRALMAMGVLIERLEADEAAARDEFAERFAALASPRQRRLVAETFG